MFSTRSLAPLDAVLCLYRSASFTEAPLDKHTVRERGSSGRHADVGGHEKGVLSKVLRMTDHG